MRQVTTITEVYTFDELDDNAKEKVAESFHINGHYNYILDEMIESLNSLKDKTFGHIDYSLSCVPDRGEFIKFTDYDDNILKDLIKDKDKCPLTGCCHDIDLLESIDKGDIESYIHMLHEQYEAMLKIDIITECCEANEYEFTIDGKMF